MLKIGIIQPNYIPWRGYFDFIHQVDIFVFLDDVQYTTRDWRNRNRIKTLGGKTAWLSVPITGGRNQLIKDARIDPAQRWKRKHLEGLRHNYREAPFFNDIFVHLEEFYAREFEMLVDLDIELTKIISGWLGIKTKFLISSSLDTTGSKDTRLLEIVEKLGGKLYLSGPAAREYMRPEIWKDAGIQLAYIDYSGYSEYQQISEPFEPAVSILDLLFMVGPEAPDYIWGRKRQKR